MNNSVGLKQLIRTLLVVLCLQLGSVSCATPPSEDLDAVAQQAYAAENWEDAARLYGQLTAQQPANGRYWYRYAVALRYTGKYTEAEKALDKATQNQVPASYVDYERAKIAGDQGFIDKAMTLLRSAATAGLAGKENVIDNPHFEGLAKHKDFNALVEQLEMNKDPCRKDVFHQFDFWIGDWEVSTGDGQVAGTNKITAQENDCVLVENWTSANGNTGMSINFYDLASNNWVQQWISPGVQIRIEGGLKDGSMVLDGFIYYAQQNNKADFRGTWTPRDDGSVRQFFEQANAEGEWSPWFEGIYRRIETK